MAANVIGAL